MKNLETLKMIHETYAQTLSKDKAWTPLLLSTEPFGKLGVLDPLEIKLPSMNFTENAKIATSARMWFKEVLIPYIRLDEPYEETLRDIVKVTHAVMESKFDLYGASPALKGCYGDWSHAMVFCDLMLDCSAGPELEDRIKLISESFHY